MSSGPVMLSQPLCGQRSEACAPKLVTEAGTRLASLTRRMVTVSL